MPSEIAAAKYRDEPKHKAPDMDDPFCLAFMMHGRDGRNE
jgi:hypothetical protein